MTETSKRIRIDSINDQALHLHDSDSIEVPGVGMTSLPLIKGDLNKITPQAQQFIAKYVRFKQLIFIFN